jgi:hypothetical protein
MISDTAIYHAIMRRISFHPLGEEKGLNTDDYFSFQQDKNVFLLQKCPKTDSEPLFLPRNDRYSFEGPSFPDQET